MNARDAEGMSPTVWPTLRFFHFATFERFPYDFGILFVFFLFAAMGRVREQSGGIAVLGWSRV